MRILLLLLISMSASADYSGQLAWAYDNCKVQIKRPMLIAYQKEAKKEYASLEAFIENKNSQYIKLESLAQKAGRDRVCHIFESRYLGGI